MMKKIFKPLAFILALTMICQIFVFSIAAVIKSGNCGTNATYTLDTETGILTLSGSGATDNYEKFEEGWSDLYRPGSSQISKSVPWKKDVNSVKTVVVGKDITEIGDNTFFQCPNVEKIVFLSKSTQISSSAFVTSESYTIQLHPNSTADEYFSSDDHTKIYFGTAGDVNDDNDINIKDVVLLAQYLAQWGVEINDINSDCNGDGTISIKDVVLLAQYLAKWPVTLG